MNDFKKNENKPKDKSESWEFSVKLPNENNPVDKRSDQKKQADKVKKKLKKRQQLTLDESSLPKMRTRTSLAEELDKNKEDQLSDVLNLAPYTTRGLALVFDSLFLWGMGTVIKNISPALYLFLEGQLNSRNMYFIFSKEITSNLILGITGFLFFFFLVIIPIAFFHISLGKKILGLRIRGSEQYTLTITQIFMRELIFKPLSMAMLIGFITPFISKKNQSVHDMICKTLVIKDN